MVSLNLSESQRAMVAARVANLKHGQTARYRNSDLSNTAVTQPDAAKMLNVSRDSVNKAAKIEREAIPEVTQAVERGHPRQSTVVELDGARRKSPA